MAMKKKRVFLRVPHGDVEKNPWNYNVMPPDKYEKLKTWLEELRKDGKPLPPIMVRPHPEKREKWQIIDGEHRWRAIGELGYTKINVFVMDVDTKKAKLLTDSFNYTKGERDEEKFIQMLHELHKTENIPILEMVKLLSISEGELIEKAALHETDAAVDLLANLQKEQIARNKKIGDDAEGVPEAWVELKFKLPVKAARIVEAELSRIEAHLSGAGRRARALEFMAVQSSQGEVTVQPEKRRKKKRREAEA